MTKRNDICETCRLAVTAGTAADDPELAGHLKNCPGCRAFAQFSAAVLAASPVIPENIPTLARIRRRERMRHLRLLMIRPLSAAAVLALVAAVVFYGEFGASRPADAAGTGYAATGHSGETVAPESADYTLALTWDSGSAAEMDLADTLAGLRTSRNWNIEAFNPITEEL